MLQLMLQLMLQQLYTLLRHISHVASSPQRLSHSPDLRFHIYHHSLVRFACLSAKDCRTPQTVTLQSLWSHRSHTHRTAYGFWVLLLCTALNRRLSAYHRGGLLHQLEKFMILDKMHWPVTFSTPPSKVGPKWR